MKERYIADIKYYIKPRMKRRWFSKDKKVYDLIECSKGEYWSDPSYGNGMGNYISFDNEEVLYSFDTYAEADVMKNELEKL